MKILILANELESLNPKKDTTFFLIKKSLEKNFTVFFSTFENINLKKNLRNISTYTIANLLKKKH